MQVRAGKYTQALAEETRAPLIPPDLWAVRLRPDYVCCVKDFAKPPAARTRRARTSAADMFRAHLKPLAQFD